MIALRRANQRCDISFVRAPRRCDDACAIIARAARPKTTRKRMGLRQGDRIRLGGGSAFFNDRLDAALELVEKGDIDVLMIETLAERTLALLHAARRAGGSGYWDKLADRLQVLLPACAKHKTKLVTNGGGAAPEACAAMIARLAREHRLSMKVAAVTGDDVTELVRASDPILVE